MERHELENYIFRKVEIVCKDGIKYAGFLKTLNDREAVLSSLYHGKNASIPLESIISIRVLNKFNQRGRYKN